MVHPRITLIGIEVFLEWKPRFLGSILNLGCVHAKETQSKHCNVDFFTCYLLYKRDQKGLIPYE